MVEVVVAEFSLLVMKVVRWVLTNYDSSSCINTHKPYL